MTRVHDFFNFCDAHTRHAMLQGNGASIKQYLPPLSTLTNAQDDISSLASESSELSDNTDVIRYVTCVVYSTLSHQRLIGANPLISDTETKVLWVSAQRYQSAIRTDGIIYRKSESREVVELQGWIPNYSGNSQWFSKQLVGKLMKKSKSAGEDSVKILLVQPKGETKWSQPYRILENGDIPEEAFVDCVYSYVPYIALQAHKITFDAIRQIVTSDESSQVEVTPGFYEWVGEVNRPLGIAGISQLTIASSSNSVSPVTKKETSPIPIWGEPKAAWYELDRKNREAFLQDATPQQALPSPPWFGVSLWVAHPLVNASPSPMVASPPWFGVPPMTAPPPMVAPPPTWCKALCEVGNPHIERTQARDGSTTHESLNYYLRAKHEGAQLEEHVQLQPSSSEQLTSVISARNSVSVADQSSPVRNRTTQHIVGLILSSDVNHDELPFTSKGTCRQRVMYRTLGHEFCWVSVQELIRALSPIGNMEVRQSDGMHPKLPLAKHSTKELDEAYYALQGLVKYQTVRESVQAVVDSGRGYTVMHLSHQPPKPLPKLLVLMQRSQGVSTWSLFIKEYVSRPSKPILRAFADMIKLQLSLRIESHCMWFESSDVLMNTHIHVVSCHLTREVCAEWFRVHQAVPPNEVVRTPLESPSVGVSLNSTSKFVAVNQPSDSKAFRPFGLSARAEAMEDNHRIDEQTQLEKTQCALSTYARVGHENAIHRQEQQRRHQADKLNRMPVENKTFAWQQVFGNVTLHGMETEAHPSSKLSIPTSNAKANVISATVEDKVNPLASNTSTNVEERYVVGLILAVASSDEESKGLPFAVKGSRKRRVLHSSPDNVYEFCWIRVPELITALQQDGDMVVRATRAHPYLALSEHGRKEANEAYFALRSLKRYQEEHDQECTRLKTEQGTPQPYLLVLMRRARGTMKWSLITELSTANDTSEVNVLDVLVKTVRSQLALQLRHEQVQKIERYNVSSTSVHVYGYRLTEEDCATWLQNHNAQSARNANEQMGTTIVMKPSFDLRKGGNTYLQRNGSKPKPSRSFNFSPTLNALSQSIGSSVVRPRTSASTPCASTIHTSPQVILSRKYGKEPHENQSKKSTDMTHSSRTAMHDNRQLVLCIVHTTGGHHEFLDHMDDQVMWVPTRQYLNATRSGVVYPKNARLKAAVKLLEWEPHPKDCDIQLARSVVEALHESNPEGQILIVRPKDLDLSMKGDDRHEYWTIPRHPWRDNKVDTAQEAFIQGMHEYLAHLPSLELKEHNVHVWKTETCSQEVNDRFQSITPCTYALFSAPRVVNESNVVSSPRMKTRQPSPTSLTMANSAKTKDASKHVLKAMERRWSDMYHEWTSSDDESDDETYVEIHGRRKDGHPTSNSSRNQHN